VEDEMESPGISRKSYSKFGSPDRLKEPATKMIKEIRNPGSQFSIFEHCNPATIKSYDEWVLDEEFSQQEFLRNKHMDMECSFSFEDKTESIVDKI
jgi:hypothetical protein